MEFVVPLHPEDLETSRHDRFCVESVLEVDDSTDIDSVLDKLTDKLLDESDRIQDAVLSHDVFDKLYSLVKAWSILGSSAKQRIIELYCSATQELLAVVAGTSAQAQERFADPRDATRAAGRLRSAFKALSYMFAVTVQVAEKTYAPKQDTLGAAAAKGKKGKGKAAAKGKKGGRGKAAAAEEEPLDDAGDIDDEGGDGAPAADNNEEDADGGWDWPALRENAVSLLTSVLAADLRRMWPLGLPEEDFVNVFVKTGSRMLASPAAMKDKGTRAATVELLGVAAARFPSVITSACVSLVAMLVSHEHAAAPAVDLVTLWATGPTPAAVAAAVAAGQVHASRAPLPTGCPAAAGETLRELARISGSGDSKDSGGLRRSAAFVMEVSERLPSLVLANVSVLLPFLDAEAYTLRSAIVTALGNIVGRVFNQQQLASAQAKAAAAVAAAGAAGGGLGEASAAAAARQAEASTLMSERTRDTLLGMMLERSLDVHALTRAAVLRAWVALVQVAAVPMDRLGAVTAMAVARLRDKGALVRKAAVQLLRALLECNPFGGVIRPDFFSAHRDSAEAWLASHAPAVLARLTGSAAAAAAASGGDAAGAKGAAKKGGKGAAASGKGAKAAGGRRAGLASVREEDEDEDDEEDDGIVELDVDEELLADSEKTMQAEADGVARPPSGTADVAVTPEVAAYVQHRALASAGLAFAQQLAGAVPGLEAMMGSKVGSDVMEAIRFLSRARLFGVPGAETGLARMLTLVWSSEASVREEVISTFDKLYILNEALEEGEEDSEAGGEGAAPAAAAAEPEAAAAAAARPKRGASGKAGAAPKKRAAAKGRGKKGGDDSEGEEDDDDDMDELPVSDDDDDVEEDDDDEDAGPRKKKKGAAAAPKRAPAAKKAAAAPKGGRGKGAGSTAAAKADAAKRASVDAKLVATNLVSLLSGASLAVRTSLEEVLAESVKRGLLPASVSDALWEMVAAGYQQHQAARLRTAKLLASVAKAAHEGNGAKLGEAQAAGLATATAQAGPVEGALIKARNAMAVLSMIGAATAKASSSSAAAPAAPAASCLDTPYALTKLAMVLSPAAIPGSPLGLGLLRAGQAALGLPGDKLDVLDLAVASGDYRLARHACAALQKLAGDSKKHPAAVAAAAAAAAAAASAADDGEDGGGKAKKAPSRARSAKGKASAGANEAPAAGSDDPEGDRARLITRIVSAAACMVRGDWDGGDVECSHYYAAAQQAIDAVFALAHRPAEVFAEVLRHMAAATFVVAGGGAPVIAPSVSRTRLSRLFFVLGHVAMKLLLAAESLGVRVKALRVKAAERGAAGGAPAPAAAAAPEPAAKGKKGKAAAPAPAAAGGAQGGIEDQLGLNAAEDEKEAEAVASIGERELVLAADTLGGLFAPLVGQVVTRQLSSASAQTASADGSAGGGDSLAQSALLALCKLMAISSELCEAHLQLLFTVLSAARSPPLRATIAIALGDLAFRFPNLIEPYTGYLYARLRDPDAGVRKNTLMVLSHLILNDMVKVKGQVGEIAVCLNDPDPRIADLTRLFFTELSQRGNNPIYNILPDTLSCLSRLAREAEGGAPSSASDGPRDVVVAGSAPLASRPFDAGTFRETVRFLLGFINKDKHAESLADKLLHRFETTADDDVHAWRDVAYALSQLPLNDKMVRRMAEGVRAYKRCLGDADVWESISGMLAKAKRSVGAGGAAKGELKAVVDEWERQLTELHAGQADDDAAASKARAAARKARRVAAAEGIDAEAIAAAAASEAVASVAAAKKAQAAAAVAAKAAGRASRKAASPGPAKARATAAAAAKKKKSKKDSDDDDGDDGGIDELDEEDDEPVAVPVKGARKGLAAPAPAKAAAPKRGLNRVVDDDDDEDEDDDGSVSAAPSAVGRGASSSSSRKGSAAAGPAGRPSSAGVGPGSKAKK